MSANLVGSRHHHASQKNITLRNVISPVLSYNVMSMSIVHPLLHLPRIIAATCHECVKLAPSKQTKLSNVVSVRVAYPCMYSICAACASTRRIVSPRIGGQSIPFALMSVHACFILPLPRLSPVDDRRQTMHRFFALQRKPGKEKEKEKEKSLSCFFII